MGVSPGGAARLEGFIQALEGPEDAVEAILHRIGQDPRHRGMQLILSYDDENREFPDWNMGFVSRPLEQTMKLCRALMSDREALRARLDGRQPSLSLLRNFVDRVV